VRTRTCRRARPSRRDLKASACEETPPQWPALTRIARVGDCDVQAGTKERAPQGPNKGTGPEWRKGCPQTMWPEPKRSPLYETGASPALGA
jgi:hypothetical protein